MNVAVASSNAPAITMPHVFAPFACRCAVAASVELTYPPPFLITLYVIDLIAGWKANPRPAHFCDHRSESQLIVFKQLAVLLTVLN
jgi:hypothetical protein